MCYRLETRDFEQARAELRDLADDDDDSLANAALGWSFSGAFVLVFAVSRWWCDLMCSNLTCSVLVRG